MHSVANAGAGVYCTAQHHRFIFTLSLAFFSLLFSPISRKCRSLVWWKLSIFFLQRVGTTCCYCYYCYSKRCCYCCSIVLHCVLMSMYSGFACSALCGDKTILRWDYYQVTRLRSMLYGDVALRWCSQQKRPNALRIRNAMDSIHTA